MESDNINSKNVEVEDLLDDDLDEPTLPKKTTEVNNEPDLSSIDFTKIMSSLQSKNPKELRKMISKMGISQAQINQMKQSYENSLDTQESNLSETDLRKRLREKLNKKRLMRQSNQIKKEHMEKMEAENKTSEVAPTVETNQETNQKTEDFEEIIIDSENTTSEISKKTLQNRKKAQKKKEKKAAEKLIQKS
jgi:hypothetical protein